MYDLAVIGAGWAGFNASVRAAQLGLKVALIDKDKLGGTCLNYGCIPTKALIQSAKVYSLIQKANNFGIEANPAKAVPSAILKRKNLILSQLNSGMKFMLKSRRVAFFEGAARVVTPTEVSAGNETINAKNILIATGSRPIELPFLKFDGKDILSSEHILEMSVIPRAILIVGGGVIGCEFASLFQMLGSRVSIVELMPQLLPNEDPEIAKKLETLFKKKGIDVNTGTDIKAVDISPYDCVLVAVGRKPDASGLGLEELGVKFDKGKVVTNEYLMTDLPGIYAAGDCTGRVMLAHYASYQGRRIAENIAHPQEAKKCDEQNVPNCIFTDPEVASVGMTEKQALERNIAVDIKMADFRSCGMAYVLDETEGFIKILVDKNTGVILGASIIGPKATELIATLAVAARSRLTVSQLQETIFAHPTLSEIIHEALQ